MTTTEQSNAALREDDGYFDPASVSWRVFSDPSSKLGGVAALLMQALNPGMMRLFDSVSVTATDGPGRAERTGRYIDTTIFGDKAHADAAGHAVQRLHSHATWTDPVSGETLHANTAPWLDWTHNTVTWGVLRSAEEFGLPLTVAEQDAFILEQHTAATFVGIDPSRLPATRVALDAYMEEQKSWMALCLPAAELSRSLRRPTLKGNPVTVFTSVVIQDAILGLLPEWGRLLYGIEGRPMNLRSAMRTTKGLMGAARKNTSYDKVITELTTKVDNHPYRRTHPQR